MVDSHTCIEYKRECIVHWWLTLTSKPFAIWATDKNRTLCIGALLKSSRRHIRFMSLWHTDCQHDYVMWSHVGLLVGTAPCIKTLKDEKQHLNFLPIEKDCLFKVAHTRSILLRQYYWYQYFYKGFLHQYRSYTINNLYNVAYIDNKIDRVWGLQNHTAL